jgi:hypothetical protein
MPGLMIRRELTCITGKDYRLLRSGLTGISMGHGAWSPEQAKSVAGYSVFWF